jgi:hypothetical protein
MQHNFKTKYMIKFGFVRKNKINYFTNNVDVNAFICVIRDLPAPANISVQFVPVYELLELIVLEVIDTRYRPVSRYKKLIIYPDNWKDIASTRINKNNLRNLYDSGAFLINTHNLYDTEENAKIQLALFCILCGIDQNAIFKITGGQLDSQSYGELVNKLYEDCPEKFV